MSGHPRKGMQALKRLVQKRQQRRGKRLPITVSTGSSAWQLPMPPELRTRFKLVSYGSRARISSGTDSNAGELVFRGNGLTAIGPADNYPLGTQSAFAGNNPSGLYYLLGSDGALGAASGMYGQYIVHGSTIKIEILGASETPNTMVLAASVFPGDSSNILTMASATCAEQPFAKRWVVPAVSTAAPQVMTNTCTTERMLGQSTRTKLPDLCGGFPAGSLTLPSQGWFWYVRVNNLNGTTTSSYYSYRVEITYDVTLFDLNGLVTTVPA